MKARSSGEAPLVGSPQPYSPPFLHRFLAGGIAGVCEILIMYPTDVVKTRAQLSTTQGPNFIKALKELSQEGVARMYRGILPPILVEAPKRAVKFSANEFYKEKIFAKQGKLSQGGAIGAGISAGCTEAFVVVPFELVKIRLQDKANQGKYTNTVDAVVKIAKAEGPFAFFLKVWNPHFGDMLLGMEDTLVSSFH